jgi:hypothetical protein
MAIQHNVVALALGAENRLLRARKLPRGWQLIIGLISAGDHAR